MCKIEEERLPQFRNLMKTIEEQVANILKMIAEMNEDGKSKQKSIDVRKLNQLALILLIDIGFSF